MIFELAQDFHDAVAAMPREHPKHHMLELLEEAIRRDIHFIARHPTTLFQCLWNTCWWYDCPEAAKHYTEPEGGWTNPPTWQTIEPRLSAVLEAWRFGKRQRRLCSLYLRSLRAPNFALSSAQVACLPGRSTVLSVAVSPDGELIVSGELDGTIRFWEVISGMLRRSAKAHASGVQSVAFAPDGKQVASCGDDGIVTLWNVQTLECVESMRVIDGIVNAVAFSADGKLLLSAGHGLAPSQGPPKIWDFMSDKDPVCLPRDDELLWPLCFAPDGRKLAAGSSNRSVRMWDLASCRLVEGLEGHAAAVTAVAFSPDGKRIATGSRDESVRVWDAGTKRQILAIRGHERIADVIRFSPDGNRLLMVDGDAWLFDLDGAQGDLGVRDMRGWASRYGSDLSGLSAAATALFSPDGQYLVLIDPAGESTLILAHSQTGRSVFAFKGECIPTDGVAFSADSKRLVAVSLEGTLHVWDVPSGRELSSVDWGRGPIDAVAVAPDGTRFVSVSRDQGVCLWTTYTATTPQHLGMTDSIAVRLLFSPNGSRFLTATYGGSMQLWDAKSGSVLAGHSVAVSEIPGLTFSPNGMCLAALAHPQDSSIRVWDTSTGREGASLVGHTGGVLSVACSSDGCLVCSGASDGTVRIWDFEARAQVKRLSGHGATAGAVAFSPDDRRVATICRDRRIHIWDIESQGWTKCLESHADWTSNLAFSCDGSLLLAGCNDEVGVWNVTSGELVRKLRGHRSWVTDVCFCLPTDRIVSASCDGTVRLWNIASREAIIPRGHGRKVDSLVFSQDGRRVLSVTGTPEYTGIVWDAETGEQVSSLRLDKQVFRARFSPDARRIAYRMLGGDLWLWDADTGRTLAHVRQTYGRDRQYYPVFSPDGCHVLALQGHDIVLLDTESGEVAVRCQGHFEGVVEAAISRDGNRIGSLSGDRTIRVWDAKSGGELLCGTLGQSAERFEFSADGRRIGCLERMEGVLRLWDIDRGEEIIVRFSTPLSGWAMAPSGHQIAIWALNMITVWDVPSARQIASFSLFAPQSVAFSPDGSRIVAGGISGEVQVLPIATGDQRRYIMEHANPAERVAFVNGCKHIVSVHRDDAPLYDDIVLVWDELSGALVGCGQGRDMPLSSWVVTSLSRMRVRPHNSGTLLERIDTREPLAWLPEKYYHVASRPGHNAWACVDGSYLALFTLEGSSQI
jgi:WD40 repeat protein